MNVETILMYSVFPSVTVGYIAYNIAKSKNTVITVCTHEKQNIRNILNEIRINLVNAKTLARESNKVLEPAWESFLKLERELYKHIKSIGFKQ